MVANDGTLYNYSCSSGILLPFINEYTWPKEVRAVLYCCGLIYCFLGVAIIADIFMCAIEMITSKTRKVYLAKPKEDEPEVVEVRVWNDTVANLTLMALGSSAPEILLSVIEIIGNDFKAGELGPGTIVGSAAFNLLTITAICIVGIPDGEIRPIKGIKVFLVTSFFSVIAYLWLLVVLVAVSENEIELWEAIVTFLLFPFMVLLAYAADKDFCGVPKILHDKKQIELGTFKPAEPGKEKNYFKDGKMDKDALLSFMKDVKKNSKLSDEDAAVVAASKLVDSQPHSRGWYRISAVRAYTGGRKTRPQLSDKLKESLSGLVVPVDEHGEKEAYDSMNMGGFEAISPSGKEQVAIIEFHAATSSVLENIGKFTVTLCRRGRMDNTVKVRVETIDGTAEQESDYVAINEILTFGPNENEKQLPVEIINDNQWEPDEEFFLKLSLLDGEDREFVTLGRTSIMEITILNDDEPGVLSFEKRGILVKESIGQVQVVVMRKNGADGDVSVKWRTIDKSAINGRDYHGGEGELLFKHAETQRMLEISIVNDMQAEKDEVFEVELFDAQGGARLGKINRTAVTITNDDDFNSVLGRLMLLTNANVDSLKIHQDTWLGQIQDAMNVNGGDIENASGMDYLMHFLTFGWKIFFALVPPPALAGGWLCFFASLGMIGFLTAIVGDLAGIFGCLVGLRDSVTAITFVALGTSLPDLFASKMAAVQEKYADNAIGNVTGSNSVNVFLGLGLPWVIATIYHTVNGNKFHVAAGSLSFSVLIYVICSLIALSFLGIRRKCAVFGKAELGGPVASKWGSCIFFIALWMCYIILSSLEAYGHIKPNI